MEKGVNIMRLNQPEMVSGLIDLCKDVYSHFPSRVIMAEIGSYAGESTQIFWEILMPVNIHCVDMWGVTEKYTESEISKAEAVFDALHSRKIMQEFVFKHKSHSRNEALKSVIPELDFVYIDASHKYEDISADIDFWIPHLKKRAVIAGHDYSDKFKGVKKAVNERFQNIKVYSDTSWAVFLK